MKDIHQTGAGDSLGVVQEAHEGSAGDAPKQISNKERNKEEPLPPPLACGEAGGTDTPLLAIRDPGCLEGLHRSRTS